MIHNMNIREASKMRSTGESNSNNTNNDQRGSTRSFRTLINTDNDRRDSRRSSRTLINGIRNIDLRNQETTMEAKKSSRIRFQTIINGTSPISVCETVPSIITFPSTNNGNGNDNDNDNNDDDVSVVSWPTSESEDFENSDSSVMIELQNEERRKNLKLASRIKFQRIINSASSKQSTQPSNPTAASSRSLSVCDTIPSFIAFHSTTRAHKYNNDDGVSVVTTQSFEEVPEFIEVDVDRSPSVRRKKMKKPSSSKSMPSVRSTKMKKPSSSKSIRSKKKVKNLVDKEYPVMLLSKRKNLAAVQEKERLHGNIYQNARWEMQ